MRCSRRENVKYRIKYFLRYLLPKKEYCPSLNMLQKLIMVITGSLLKQVILLLTVVLIEKSSCGVSQLDGSVSLINIVLTPREELNGKYIHYLLRNYRFSEEYYRNGRGIVADLWTTRYSEMKSILIPVPPRTEQEQIVRFLDWKVSEINKLIGIRKQEVVELKDLASSIIEQAITKGIDNGIVLNKTGIYYLPEIPNGWEFCD